MKKRVKAKIRNRVKKTPGLPPGTLVYTGQSSQHTIDLDHISYTPQGFEKKRPKNLDACRLLDKEGVDWLNINGLHNIDLIKSIGHKFDLHLLMMEDIVNIEQRPKMEDFDYYIFFSLKMLTYKHEELELEEEQVSLVLSQNRVLSFQEKPGDVFDPVRQRLEMGKGSIRSRGADYLIYALIDTIVDHYFVIMETLGDQIEDLEELIISNPEEWMLERIQRYKKILVRLRRSTYPLREAISRLNNYESPLITSQTSRFFSDVHDHTMQIMETIETYKDINFGLRDMYLSQLSHKMNQVMQVLTIISTIFIPLTFIAGVYGMNFEWMPELHWKAAYPVVWIVMGTIAVLLSIYFKRKKWW